MSWVTRESFTEEKYLVQSIESRCWRSTTRHFHHIFFIPSAAPFLGICICTQKHCLVLTIHLFLSQTWTQPKNTPLYLHLMIHIPDKTIVIFIRSHMWIPHVTVVIWGIDPTHGQAHALNQGGHFLLPRKLITQDLIHQDGWLHTFFHFLKTKFLMKSFHVDLKVSFQLEVVNQEWVSIWASMP